MAFYSDTDSNLSPLISYTKNNTQFPLCIKYGSRVWRVMTMHILFLAWNLESNKRTNWSFYLYNSLAYRIIVSTLSLYYRYYQTLCFNELKLINTFFVWSIRYSNTQHPICGQIGFKCQRSYPQLNCHLYWHVNWSLKDHRS